MKRILTTIFIILSLTTIFSGCASKITQKDIQTALENQGLTVSYNNELQEVNNGEFLINGKVKLGVGYYKTESQREEGKKTGEEYLKQSGANHKYLEAKNILFALYPSQDEKDVVLEGKIVKAIEELNR
jgi:hypothetical protein